MRLLLGGLGMLVVACGGAVNPTEGSGGGPGSSTGGAVATTGGATASGGMPSNGAAASGGAVPGGAPSLGTGGASCDALRVEFLAIYETHYAIAALCVEDDDCNYTSFSHNCGQICPAPMNKTMAAEIGVPLYEFAARECGDCWENYDGVCSAPPNETRCVDGVCEFTEPYADEGKLVE